MPDPDKKELSTETRLLLAFILMGAVLFTTPYFFKTPPPAPTPVNKTAPAAPVKAAEAPLAIPMAPSKPSPGQVSAGSEETVALETDLYHILFSNRGAVIRSWILKKY